METGWRSTQMWSSVRFVAAAGVAQLSNQVYKQSVRFLPKARNRFYRHVRIVDSNGGHEICLDQRKLKTPQGSKFVIPNKTLATAVASEWSLQPPVLEQHNMHLTALCNTALDNPLRQDPTVLVEQILTFLETDTICFRPTEPTELARCLTVEWDPVLRWFEKKFEVPLSASTDFAGPTISEETKHAMFRYLSSLNMWALTGFQFAVEAVKSFVLVLAAVDKQISVEEAVRLSRLETEFQISHWGSVEWAHDLDLMDLRARLSAAIFFIHCSGESDVQSQKVRSKDVY